jgi:hypothetical protein
MHVSFCMPFCLSSCTCKCINWYLTLNSWSTKLCTVDTHTHQQRTMMQAIVIYSFGPLPLFLWSGLVVSDSAWVSWTICICSCGLANQGTVLALNSAWVVNTEVHRSFSQNRDVTPASHIVLHDGCGRCTNLSFVTTFFWRRWSLRDRA